MKKHLLHDPPTGTTLMIYVDTTGVNNQGMTYKQLL